MSVRAPSKQKVKHYGLLISKEQLLIFRSIIYFTVISRGNICFQKNMLFVKLVEVLAKLSMVAHLFPVGQRYTTQDRKFYKLQSKSLLGNVTIVSHVKDHYDCSFMCVKYGHLTCLSFNFNTTVNEDGFHFCELSNSERYLEPQKTHEMPGNDYYGTTTEVSHVETCKCRTNTVYGLQIDNKS